MRVAFVCLCLCLLGSLLFTSVSAQQSYNTSVCVKNGAKCPTGGSCTGNCTGSTCQYTCRYDNCVSTATVWPGGFSNSNKCSGSSPSSSSSGLSSGAAAGIAIVVALGVIAALVAVCFFARCACFSYRQRQDQAPLMQSPPLMQQQTNAPGYQAPVFPGQPPLQHQQYAQQPQYGQQPPQQQQWGQPTGYQSM